MATTEPIRRFSPFAEDQHLEIERRLPVPIYLSIPVLMEDKIDPPRPGRLTGLA
jgi:hypothetical protein